jgi:hypothetical protein
MEDELKSEWLRLQVDVNLDDLALTKANNEHAYSSF